MTMSNLLTLSLVLKSHNTQEVQGQSKFIVFKIVLHVQMLCDGLNA